MRIIKDNSNKEIEIKCECCGTIYAKEIKEIIKQKCYTEEDGYYFRTYCPVCGIGVTIYKFGANCKEIIQNWFDEFKEDFVFNVIMTGLLSILIMCVLYLLMFAYMEIASLG